MKNKFSTKFIDTKINYTLIYLNEAFIQIYIYIIK